MEIKNNKITTFDVLNYRKCGGYHGHKSSNDPRLNTEETCFGVYMHLIENVFSLDSVSKNNRAALDNPYYQGQIDMLVTVLENYVLNNCINYEKNLARFDRWHFSETFRNFKVNNQTLDAQMNLMSYVTGYILMQYGIRFEDEKFLLENCPDFSAQKISRNNKHVYVSETKNSIDMKREMFKDQTLNSNNENKRNM